MARYVDAEKIEKALWDSLRGYRHTKEICAVKNCILEIEATPATDVVEVRHGEWIRHKENCLYNKCSICSYEHCREDNYCPNCGAKMDGEKSVS